jgi:hypothetical protein
VPLPIAYVVVSFDFKSEALGVTMITILLVIAVLALLGVLPRWPHSRNWGYGPTGGLGLLVLILIVVALSGRL